MGSLMSGWDSQVQDPKIVKIMRNKSLTKQRIEEYWKSKKETEEPVSSSSEVVRRARSLPVVDSKDGHFILGKEVDVNLDKLINTNCWWTGSKWAFLNEPPVMIASEVPKSKYNVAKLVSDNRIPGL